MVSKKRRCSSIERAVRQLAQVDAVEARHHMADADEAAEQAVPVERCGRRARSAGARPMQAAALPVGAALGVEMRRDHPAVGLDIGRVVGLAEEAIERLPCRQAAGCRELQPVERDMRPAEIDGRDARRIGRQVGEHVAAARGDGHNVAIGVERQRLEIDLGVFPDLRIDQAAEQPLEHTLEKALSGQCSMAANRLFQADTALALRISHSSTPKRLNPLHIAHDPFQFDDGHRYVDRQTWHR